ncbi:MAG TPA: DinB family protein [Longimicrobiales bacterium]|nr:DinB family protein [Longimicrobiales bacterium]
MSDEPYTNLLEEALEAWEDARRGVLEEAEVIPDDRYDYRPHPESRSVQELLLHILESGEMMSGELSREDGDFTRQPFPDHIREHAGDLPADPDPVELRDLLMVRFAEGAAALRGRGELHMLQFIKRFDGKPGTRLAWMHHGIAHEMYHRGQLALYARMLDLTPALTRRIRGE